MDGWMEAGGEEWGGMYINRIRLGTFGLLHRGERREGRGEGGISSVTV